MGRKIEQRYPKEHILSEEISFRLSSQSHRMSEDSSVFNIPEKHKSGPADSRLLCSLIAWNSNKNQHSLVLTSCFRDRIPSSIYRFQQIIMKEVQPVKVYLKHFCECCGSTLIRSWYNPTEVTCPVHLYPSRTTFNNI